MTLADELFRDVDVRQSTPAERLYRLVESVFDDSEVWPDRVTWDRYDRSVEVYMARYARTAAPAVLVTAPAGSRARLY